MLIIEQAIEVVNGKLQSEFGISKPIWAFIFYFNKQNSCMSVYGLKFNNPPGIIIQKSKTDDVLDGEIIKIK
jgi:hypothetical protein